MEGGRPLVRCSAPYRPALYDSGLLTLSLTSTEFLPGVFTTDDKASLLLFGIVAGLAVGIFEELGWTGFAIPRLRLRYSVFGTGLTVGVLWGASIQLSHGRLGRASCGESG